jgi:hypothetical protein
MWQQWVNLILGLWIALSAYLNFTPMGIATNLTIVGLVIALMALWGGLSRSSYVGYEDRGHRHA